MRRTSSAAVGSTLAAALAGLALAGCGGREVPDAAPIAVERADGEPRCSEAQALAVFGTGDGFTFSHALALCKSGRIELHYSTRRVIGPLEAARLGYEIPASDVSRIEAALRDADLPSLDESYVSEAADIRAYSVTYGGKTVYADEFEIRDGNVPAPLLELIGLFESVLDPAVADAEEWIREDPALLLEYEAEQIRRMLEHCRSSARLNADARRRLQRVRALLEGGLTEAEARKADTLLGVVARC
jgi:hypothetical protein